MRKKNLFKFYLLSAFIKKSNALKEHFVDTKCLNNKSCTGVKIIINCCLVEKKAKSNKIVLIFQDILISPYHHV